MALHSKTTRRAGVRAFVGAGQPLLEAQVVDAADSLAYDTHDIDDALGLGLITLDDFEEVAFWRQAVERVRRQHGQLGDRAASSPRWFASS